MIYQINYMKIKIVIFKREMFTCNLKMCRYKLCNSCVFILKKVDKSVTHTKKSFFLTVDFTFFQIDRVLDFHTLRMYISSITLLKSLHP